MKKFKKEYHTIKLVFVCNNKLLFALKNTIHSIVLNSSYDEHFLIYILSNDISKSDIKKIERQYKKKIKTIYKHVSKKDFLNLPQHKNALETYFKFCIPKLIPEEDKLLFLDPDILVKGSLLDLWKTDLKGYSCAAVKDYANYNHDRQRLNIDSYYNAGVMLINNAIWKQHEYYDKFFEITTELIKNNTLKWADQDVMNVVMNNKILDLDYKYNLQEASYWTQMAQIKHLRDVDPVIVHYNVPAKPWKPNSDPNFYYDDYLFTMSYKRNFISKLGLVLKQK